ncbi:unnamed protein product, partial [marine sediment metagenome]
QKIGPRKQALLTELNNCTSHNQSILAIDFGSNFYSHYYGAITLEAAGKLKTGYRNELGSNLNKIYDNGFEIWIK